MKLFGFMITFLLDLLTLHCNFLLAQLSYQLVCVSKLKYWWNGVSLKDVFPFFINH